MLEEYGKVVDERDESKGLNNYSAAITALAAGHENGDALWYTTM